MLHFSSNQAALWKQSTALGDLKRGRRSLLPSLCTYDQIALRASDKHLYYRWRNSRLGSGLSASGRIWSGKRTQRVHFCQKGSFLYFLSLCWNSPVIALMVGFCSFLSFWIFKGLSKNWYFIYVSYLFFVADGSLIRKFSSKMTAESENFCQKRPFLRKDTVSAYMQKLVIFFLQKPKECLSTFQTLSFDH